jgi:tetratricopeptide (TPR) repeat protein
MRHQHPIRIGFLTLSAGIALLSGCASSQFPMVQPVRKMNREEAARFRAEEYFVKARDYDRRGLDKMAEHFYEMAYELDPDVDLLKRLLAEKYLISGKYPQALALVKGNKPIDELSPEKLRLVSNLYMRMGQYPEAAHVLESAPDLSPQEQYTLGFIYESTGELTQAIEQYREYYQGDGHSLELGLKLARLYIRNQQPARAESMYVDLEKSFGASPDIFNGLGNMKLSQEDTAMAVNLFKMAYMADSTNEEAMRNIARVAIQREEFDDAITYYKRLFETSDPNIGYGRTLALLYYYNNQFDKAEGLLKGLLAENVDDYELHFYLGLVFAAQDQYALAEMELKKAIAIRDDFPDAWQHLCYIALKEKDSQKPVECAQRYVEALPEAARAWRMLGYVRNVRKEYEKGVKALQKAVALDTADALSWYELGSAYERVGKHDAAADAFRTVLRLKPGDDAASNYLGYMWAEQGVKLDSAKALLEQALDQSPDNGAYLDSYAWIFYKMGDYDSAYAYIQKAVEIIAKDPVIYSHLGDIQAALKNYTEAIAAYRKSIELGSDEKKRLEQQIQRLETKSGGAGQAHGQ